MYTGMSPPISSTVKERVIQLYLQGKGRNEIAEILNLSHIRISQGSVTNILRTYKANTGKASTTRDFLKASEPSGSPSQLQTSPTSEMKQEAQIPVSEGPDPFQEPPSIEDAKDPEELKGLEVPIALATSTSATITTFSTLIPSSSSRSPVPEAYLAGLNSYPYLYSPFNLGYLSPQISEVNLDLVNRVNLDLVNPRSPSAYLQDSEKEKEKETTHEEAQEVQVQVQVQVQSSEVRDQDQEESFMDLGWSKVIEEVMEAKKQRHDELLLIEQKTKELEQRRMHIDRARYELENKEVDSHC